MAEGGFDFEMDEFGRDDFGKETEDFDDPDDQRVLDDETTSFIDRRYDEIPQADTLPKTRS